MQLIKTRTQDCVRSEKTRRFARAAKPRQMRLSSDGRILQARIDAGRKHGLYEPVRFIMAYHHNKGFTGEALRQARSYNGVGRPPHINYNRMHGGAND
jgi:hypothetical protein